MFVADFQALESEMDLSGYPKVDGVYPHWGKKNARHEKTGPRLPNFFIAYPVTLIFLCVYICNYRCYIIYI